jgi:hypothetical protein
MAADAREGSVMIGAVPVAALAPLEYRYALDAAMPLLATLPRLYVRCDEPALQAEVKQRIPSSAPLALASGALWIEPQTSNWRMTLDSLAALPTGAPLVVVASRPLARLLPERRAWPSEPLGLSPRGLTRLRRGLAAVGFSIEAAHGLHTLPAMLLGLLGGLCQRGGRPQTADRFHFAARRHYHGAGWPAAPATVSLLIARRGGG